MDLSPADRAKRVKLIIFDVDGVLTDGGIWIFPSHQADTHDSSAQAKEMAAQGGYAIHSSTMIEAKGFNAQDGSGISLARIGGMKCAIITKRISETVALRARDLRLEYVYMGQAFKMKAVREIMAREDITLEEIAYVGDDVIDLPVMREVGLSIAVANARREVKAAAHYITPSEGGHGAGRDAIDFILESQGLLQECIEKYIDERNPIAKSMDIGQGNA